jgi:hypothetical protein
MPFLKIASPKKSRTKRRASRWDVRLGVIKINVVTQWVIAERESLTWLKVIR